MAYRQGLKQAIAVVFTASGLIAHPAGANERVQITGEIIDTWCYLSGVMGGPDAVVGSAHHTCAVWCAAGGIPVGLLGEDGKLYMVLKLEGAGTVAGGERILSIQSHKVTADGQLYLRDGLNYLIVDKVVADAGITVRNHEDFGVVPPTSLPDAEIERLKKP
ncbi:MAG: hypothetical protein WCH83_09920 [Alphaproteobacteria bacterium]